MDAWLLLAGAIETDPDVLFLWKIESAAAAGQDDNENDNDDDSDTEDRAHSSSKSSASSRSSLVVEAAYSRAMASVPTSAARKVHIVFVYLSPAAVHSRADACESATMRLLAACPQLALLAGDDLWRFFPATLHHRLKPAPGQ